MSTCRNCGSKDRDPSTKERFIREHASRLDAARCALLDSARHEKLLFSAEQCWRFARELWDAKPEDC